MTPQDLASFTVANNFMGWFGFALGFFVSGFFTSIINHFAHGFNRPRRIKYRSLNLKNHDFDYLYLYRGRYYEKEQYDFLINQRKAELKR